MYGVVGKNGFNDIQLTRVDIQQNELIVQCNQPVVAVHFIGQNGVEKKVVLQSDRAAYEFQPEDTYIRTEILSEHCKLYLNPVFRHDGQPMRSDSANINWIQTSTFRLVFMGIIGTGFIIRRRVPLRNRKRRLLIKNILLLLKTKLESEFF